MAQMFLAVITSGSQGSVTVLSGGRCDLSRGSVRRCCQSARLALGEYTSRKLQQVGEQNCQPEGTACQKLGFQQAAKTPGHKRNTQQPARESEGQLHTGPPHSTATETSVL